MKEQYNAIIRQYWDDVKTVKNFVGGEFVSGKGSKVVIHSAHDESELLSYPDADASIIDMADKAAQLARKAWWGLTAQARGQVMFRIGAKLRDNLEDLAIVEAYSSNKPIRDANVEVAKVAEMFEYYAGWTDKLHGDVIPVPTSHLNYVTYQPLGTVLQITPWNAPIFTCGWQLAPAIAAGNAVILKPSELTPVSSILVAALAEQAGLPKGLINVIAGYGHTAGQAAIQNADIRKVVFVGSPATGKKIAMTSAERGIPCVLELGGKSANIVFEDADLDLAVRGAQAAIFAGAGQSCVSGSRLLVQESIYNEFCTAVAQAAKHFIIGDPLSVETQVGPINNAKQYAHVTKMLDVAKAEGAKVVDNGLPSVPEGTGFYVNPTLLKGRNSMACAQEEIFGPVVVAIPFKDEDDAIAIANDSRFGLAGAVWTKDVGRAHRIADQVKAGTFWINSYKTINVASPFGGFGDSGYGRSSGIDALREYSEVKSVWVETARTPAMNFGYGANLG
ncbi:aldehyde dehydrogenase family protein [Marinomonas sp. THO17]|uniref:aldehyde dehydrogenase family protein n=1 Tax=Marinomonas sp. THO17 TaxID=3149048 RepID=UPI00336C26D0